MATTHSTAARTPVYPGHGIDFITSEYDERGNFASINGLDVPPEPFETGDLRGQRAAYQLMAAAEKLPEEQWDGWFETVVHSAVAAISETGDTSRRGAAVGLLYILDQMLAAYARTGMWRSVMQFQMDFYRSACVEEHEKHLQSIDTFVTSMMVPKASPRPDDLM